MKFLLFAIPVLLTACIPAPLGKYYKPIYADAAASYSGNACSGQAGAPASLSIPLPQGVTLHVNASRAYGENSQQDRSLHLSIQIPTGVAVQFESDSIRIAAGSQGGEWSAKPAIDVFAAVMVPAGHDINLQNIAPTPFDEAQGKLRESNLSATASFSFSWKDNFVPQSVTMELPAIIANKSPNGEAPLVPNTLHIIANAKKKPEIFPGQYKSSTSLIYPTRESEETLARKYTSCLKGTPNLKCNQILLYDEGRFNATHNGFNYAGRMYVFDVERHTPFSVDLSVKTTNPSIWKFATNTMRVTDKETGESRSYQFDKFPLNLSYQVALDTRVRGVNDAPYSKETRISIVISLGNQELQKYTVLLPPLWINGERHQFSPIELDKRVFDFGLEPFNC